MPTKQEKNKFYKEVETIVETLELDWIEAILHYCQQTGMEVEVASSLVGDKLKRKMTEVAINKNMLKKSNKLKV